MLSLEALDLMHRCRGFNGTGYHYYIRKGGTLYLTRPVRKSGLNRARALMWRVNSENLLQRQRTRKNTE